MTLVGGSGRLFTKSMNALNNASALDGLNAVITSDIECLRHEFAHIDTTGSYTTTPEYIAAESSDLDPEFFLGPAFLSYLETLPKDQADEEDNVHCIRLTTETIAERSVQRSLKAMGNAVEVTYIHAGETVLTTRLLSPAAGWLP